MMQRRPVWRSHAMLSAPQHSIPGLHGGHDRLQSPGVVRVAGEHLAAQGGPTFGTSNFRASAARGSLAAQSVDGRSNFSGLAGKRTLDHASILRRVDPPPPAGRTRIPLGVRGPTDGHSGNPVPESRSKHEDWLLQLGGFFTMPIGSSPASVGIFAHDRSRGRAQDYQVSSRLGFIGTGCTSNVQPTAARLVSGGPGIPACD
jgi:hypothetical protein